jgi:uncharacterized protein (TIGR03435 family)
MINRALHRLAVILIAVTATALITIGLPFMCGQEMTPPAAVAAEETKMPKWQVEAGGEMAFEVASIRPIKPGEITPPNAPPLSYDDAYRPTGGIFTAASAVVEYIQFAYKLNQNQQSLLQTSLPKWAIIDRYEIHAKSENQSPTKDQMRLMMQSLLGERFGLKVHFEAIDTPVLALTLIKPGNPGPKLRPHEEGPACDYRPPSNDSGLPPERTSVYPLICDAYMGRPMPDHSILVGSRNTTLDLMSAFFARQMEHPVVDRTGLTGRFDFTLNFTPEAGSRMAAPGWGHSPMSKVRRFWKRSKNNLGSSSDRQRHA